MTISEIIQAENYWSRIRLPASRASFRHRLGDRAARSFYRADAEHAIKMARYYRRRLLAYNRLAR